MALKFNETHIIIHPQLDDVASLSRVPVFDSEGTSPLPKPYVGFDYSIPADGAWDCTPDYVALTISMIHHLMLLYHKHAIKGVSFSTSYVSMGSGVENTVLSSFGLSYL